LFFSFQLLPSALVDAAVPALALAAVAITTKFVTARLATRTLGIGERGRLRAGATLAARGEFSIVIASLGLPLTDGRELSSVAAAFVLTTAVASPLLAKYIDRRGATMTASGDGDR
jgi:CPA2 family monovalent cation:H+ antiporter-2